MGRRASRGMVLGLALALCAPVASAHASVVIGSAMGHTPNIAPNIVAGATYTQTALPDGEAAPGGLTSPVNGTVINYRLMNSGSAQPVALRIVRPFGSPGMFTGAGTSASQLPPQIGLNTVAVSLPIAVGDRVGIDCCAGASNNITFRPAGPHTTIGTTGAWTPVGTLQDGGPGVAPDNVDTDLQLMLAAEIEPSNAFTASPPTRQGRAVTTAVTVPNAGLIELVQPPAGKKKKKKKKPEPKLTAAPVTASGQGTVAFTMTIAKKTATTLTSFKKSFTIRYTPTYGQAAERSVEVAYKRKKPKKKG